MSVVEWEDSARDELADIWVEASPDEREKIAALIEQLERDLRREPFDVGESRTGRVRVEVRSPLVFWFDVTPDGAVVRVIRVRRWRRRKP
jgi:hypothetical protein